MRKLMQVEGCEVAKDSQEWEVDNEAREWDMDIEILIRGNWGAAEMKLKDSKSLEPIGGNNKNEGLRLGEGKLLIISVEQGYL